MNAPRKGWSNATLATIRLYAEERTPRTAAMVLAALAGEPGRYTSMSPYVRAAVAATELADVAVALVESRDVAVFGDIVDSAPARANDTEPIPNTERSAETKP